MSNIFVTNHSDKPLKDGFAGVVYDFLPGTTLEIPIETAKHIFGYEEQNKEVYLARLGWIKTANDLDTGFEILSKWELSTQPPKKNQLVSPVGGKSTSPFFKEGRGKDPTGCSMNYGY